MTVIERLVGFGADMGVISLTGNNVLHEVLSLSNMTKPSNDTPEIKKVLPVPVFSLVV